MKERLTNIDSDGDFSFLGEEKLLLFYTYSADLPRFNTVFDDENNETHTVHIFVRNLISRFLSLYFRRRYSLIKIM